MRMLAFCSPAVAGFVRWVRSGRWCGLPVLGYLLQEFGFYPELRQDYLEYMAALKGLPRTEAARQIDALLGAGKSH